MARRWASSSSSAHAADASATSTAANIIRIPDLRSELILTPARRPFKHATGHGKHVSGTGPKMWCSTSDGTREETSHDPLCDGERRAAGSTWQRPCAGPGGGRRPRLLCPILSERQLQQLRAGQSHVSRRLQTVRILLLRRL